MARSGAEVLEARERVTGGDIWVAAARIEGMEG